MQRLSAFPLIMCDHRLPWHPSENTHSESRGWVESTDGDGDGGLQHPPCGPNKTVTGSRSPAPEEAEPLNHSSGSPAPGACCDPFITRASPTPPFSSPRSKCQLPQRKSFVLGLLQFKHHYEKQTPLITPATPGGNELSSRATTFRARGWTVRTAPPPPVTPLLFPPHVRHCLDIVLPSPFDRSDWD